ncbi:MAG: MATE family efflux transporter, partial [Gemmatimonadetes bacterium]
RMHVIRQMVPGRADLAAMARLAAPVAVVQVGLLFMGFVDTVMVGHVSQADLAAVGLGNVYFFAAAVFGMGTLFALDPVVSQAYGAADREGIARAVQRGGVFAVLLTVGASALLVPAEAVLSALGQPTDVVPVAADYVRGLIPGVFAFYAFIALRQTLQAMGRVAPVVVVILAANVLNAVLNWVFIFGNLGVPPMGAVGSAWATTLARWAMVAGLLWAAWPLLRDLVRPLRRAAFEIRPLVRLLRVGAPIGGQFFLEWGVFGVTGLLMGLLGTTELAAHQIALNLSALTFMIAVGATQAGSVLVGQAIGAEDPPRARRAAGAALLLGGGVMLVTGGVFLAAPGPLAGLYTDDLQVLALAVLLIPVAGVFQVFDGLQTVANGILRGTGDTTTPMVVN